MNRHIDPDRVERLRAFTDAIRDGRRGPELIESYDEDLRAVTPFEVMHIMHQGMADGVDPQETLRYLDRLIHVFHRGLVSFETPAIADDSFLGLLDRENAGLLEALRPLREELKAHGKTCDRKRLDAMLEPLFAIDVHYLKKENILFPALEKASPEFAGLAIMWALQDGARASLKRARAAVGDATADELVRALGDLFFHLVGLVQKERLILFPCAAVLFREEDLDRMAAQAQEYGYAFIEGPVFEVREESFSPGEDWRYRSQTGELDYDQLTRLLSHLPVDITFVDEYDKVRYFSRPKDRFFPRSPAIIGRDVRYCHPPASVDKVLEIVSAFRTGSRDSARFWIHLHGRFVLIQYFAMRDQTGRYRGTLEVSQDISELSSLEGDRRLVDWGEDA